MYKILLFAIALQIAHSSYVEENPKCAKGPSYWCQSVATSKECSAFKHCLQTVWSKHSEYLQDDAQLLNVDINSPNPNPCSNCLQCVDAKVNYCPYVKNFVDEIELLRNSKLPATSICKLLEQCKASNTEKPNKEEGEDHRFKCGIHPREHCATLENAKKCSTFATCLSQWSSSGYQYVLKPQSLEAQPNVASEKTCGFCIFLFNKLHEVLEQNQTEVDIEQYLLGACALLPTKDEANKCNEEVQKYLPEIIQLLRNNVDPGIICRVLKMCDDKNTMEIVNPKPNQGKHLIGGDEVVSEEEKLKINTELREFLSGVKVRVVNEESAVIETPLSVKKSEKLVNELKQSMGVGCELCQIVLSAAKSLIENKVDDKKVLAFIDKELCARLGQYRSACSDYVNLEGEQLLELLRKAVDPALICEMMGFCLKVQVKSERLYDLNVRNTLNCTLCKMVFTEVKKKLSQHEEEQRIIDYVNKNLCERVGKSREMCKTLIDAYGPIFLEIIARDVNPQQLCEIIGMCTKAEDVTSVPFAQILPAVPVIQPVKANETCVVCEFVVKLLSEYANKNSTEPEIEKLLNMICDKMMPATVQPQCTEFVSQYGPVVISLIVNGIKPDQVCTFIGLCPKPTDFLLPPPVVQVPRGEDVDHDKKHFYDEEHLFKHRAREEAREEAKKQEEMNIVKPASNQTLQCSLCLYVAEIVDTQLKQNKTEEQITREVELVCNLFPGDLRQECKSFLDEYMPYILQLVAAELDAESACSALKLCRKQIENDIFRRTFVNKLPTKN